MSTTMKISSSQMNRTSINIFHIYLKTTIFKTIRNEQKKAVNVNRFVETSVEMCQNGRFASMCMQDGSRRKIRYLHKYKEQSRGTEKQGPGACCWQYTSRKLTTSHLGAFQTKPTTVFVRMPTLRTKQRWHFHCFLLD